MRHGHKFWIDGGREWIGMSAVMVVVHSQMMALDEYNGGKINSFPENNEQCHQKSIFAKQPFQNNIR